MKQELENTRWYDYTAGHYCGVYMPEDVMRNLVKLQSKYTEEMKKVLQENKEKLIASHWTMATSEGKPATYVKFALPQTDEDVQSRINLFKIPEPKYVEKVFFVDSYEEAKKICEQLHEEG